MPEQLSRYTDNRPALPDTAGVFDRFHSLPIGRSAQLIGSMLGGSSRLVLTDSCCSCSGTCWGLRIETDAASALAAALLAIGFGFSLSWLTVLVAALVRDETIVSTVGFIQPFPLVFGTGMAIPFESMPAWLQTWSELNPVNHAIEASRGLLRLASTNIEGAPTCVESLLHSPPC